MSIAKFHFIYMWMGDNILCRNLHRYPDKTVSFPFQTGDRPHQTNGIYRVCSNSVSLL